MKLCTLSLYLLGNLKLFVNVRTVVTWSTGDKDATWGVQAELVAEFALLEISLYPMRIN